MDLLIYHLNLLSNSFYYSKRDTSKSNNTNNSSGSKQAPSPNQTTYWTLDNLGGVSWPDKTRISFSYGRNSTWSKSIELVKPKYELTGERFPTLQPPKIDLISTQYWLKPRPSKIIQI